MKYLLLSVCLTAALYGYCQSKNTAIHIWDIAAKSANANTGFSIRVEVGALQTTIILKRLDSIMQTAMEKDPLYKEYRSAIKNALSVDEVTQQAEKLGDVVESYTVYTIDTVLLQGEAHRQIAFNVDSLNATGITQLQRSSTAKMGSIGGGYAFHIRYFQGKKKKLETYLTSPDANSHPLLYRFITQILGDYRESHPNSFLEKKWTGGY